MFYNPTKQGQISNTWRKFDKKTNIFAVKLWPLVGADQPVRRAQHLFFFSIMDIANRLDVCKKNTAGNAHNSTFFSQRKRAKMVLTPEENGT